jgi:hypothetical protein
LHGTVDTRSDVLPVVDRTGRTVDSLSCILIYISFHYYYLVCVCFTWCVCVVIRTSNEF